MADSTKQRIIELSFLSPEEIAETIGTTVQYVNKVLREANKTPSAPPLTLQTYATAQCNGITKKNDLAAHFGVNRKTINRFENRPEIKVHFAAYMELRRNGYNLESIRDELRRTAATLALFEPRGKALTTIGALLAVLDKKTN